MNQGDKLKYILNFNVYFFHHHRWCWPTSIQYLTVDRAAAFLYNVPCTHNVGLPTQVRFNVGPVLQLIVGSMLVNRLRR